MDRIYNFLSRYDQAVELLPYSLRGPARLIDEMDKTQVEEFRLRIGQPPKILLPDGERPFGSITVGQKELLSVMEIATAASAHAVRDSIKNGYITARGGYRVGLGGHATVRDGEVTGFQHLSSAAIRITKELPGLSDAIMPQITTDKALEPTLILSPPGVGKTTVLRDIIRACAQMGQRVSVADERGEVAALRDGSPQMELGPSTDVLSGCRKSLAVIMLLRAMNPEIIAMDEITAVEDTQALESAANCGVTLLATAHGTGLEDLMGKPMYRRMMRKGLFTRLVVITRGGRGERQYTVTKVGEAKCSE